MWLNKMRKVTVAVALLALFAGGAGAFLHLTAAEQPPPPLPAARMPVTGALMAAKDQETPVRRFHIACEVFEVGKDGKAHAITRPQLQTSNDQVATCFVGQDVPVPGKLEGVDYVNAGAKISATVTSRKDGRLRLDIAMEVTGRT